MYPWRQQTIDTSRGPAGSYRNLRKPLGQPPDGMEWKYDESRAEKWILQRINQTTAQVSSEMMGATNTPPKRTSSSSSDEEQQPEDKLILSKRDNNTTNSNNLIEGEDYLKHIVLPDLDTFQGLCLRYKITAVQLRQANGGFSGSNLRLAPPVLYIPLNKGRSLQNIRAQDKSSMEYKIHSLLAEFPRLRHNEAKAYLELADGDLESAKQEAQEDLEWEQQQNKKNRSTKSNNPDRNIVYVGVPLTGAAKQQHDLELEMKPLVHQQS